MMRRAGSESPDWLPLRVRATAPASKSLGDMAAVGAFELRCSHTTLVGLVPGYQNKDLYFLVPIHGIELI